MHLPQMHQAFRYSHLFKQAITAVIVKETETAVFVLSRGFSYSTLYGFFKNM